MRDNTSGALGGDVMRVVCAEDNRKSAMETLEFDANRRCDAACSMC